MNPLLYHHFFKAIEFSAFMAMAGFFWFIASRFRQDWIESDRNWVLAICGVAMLIVLYGLYTPH